jgi:probable DNA repair protein
MLASLAALDRVAGRMRFSDALARCARMCAETLFQPETPEVPVQILGVLESAGMAFDYLWIAGMTDEAWPLAARPTPLIPLALQRAAGVPEASPATALEVDARITRGWLRAAAEVVVSHPSRVDDRALAPSVLVRDVPEIAEAELGALARPDLAGAIHRAGRIERAPDFRGPPVRAPGDERVSIPVAGGTSVFRDQAACPFRAFATHRLRAKAMRDPPTALDDLDRGIILHALLHKLWEQLKSKAVLDASSERDVESALATAVDHAIRHLRGRRPAALGGALEALERERLARLARAWLEKERMRSAFEVVALEQKRALGFGGITVSARLDRMDRVLGDGGGYVVLDYKTGEAKVADWLGARPNEPQLLLYALGAPENVSGVAFACVKAGEMEFKGVARNAGMIPGVKLIADQRSAAAQEYRDWDELIAHWRKELEDLGREFGSGEASVQPRYGEETCRNCDLGVLCRINERRTS